MDFIRRLLRRRTGLHERSTPCWCWKSATSARNFEAAFPQLEVVWLATSAGEDQVLLVTARIPLTKCLASTWRGPPMTMITLKNVILRRSAKVLLDGASVTINPGEKVGLVGRNGAGKSTLFALFNGTLHEDGGDFSMPEAMAPGAGRAEHARDRRVGHRLRGRRRHAAGRTARGAGARSRPPTTADPDDHDIGMELAHAYTDLADAGEHDAVPRAQALILGLGFKAHELDQPVNSFSGGWRMRLQLARALMCPSDLLLLDEPTNHLDLDALVWLEAWLQKYAGTMIVISHDREFLDAVTDVTLHIENASSSRATAATTAPSRHARAAAGAAAVGLRQAAGQDRPPAEVHRPLQGQGQQGQAGAKPRQGAGAHGEGRAAAGRGRLHLRVQGAGQHPEPDAVDQRCAASATRSRTSRPRPSCAASTARCWPASASASWAPTARASRRW